MCDFLCYLQCFQIVSILRSIFRPFVDIQVYDERKDTKLLNEIRGLRDKNLQKLNLVPFISKDYY